jgi:phytoene synthase
MSSRRRGASVIAEAAFGPDWALMLTHFPTRVQPAVAALWAVDEAMSAVIVGASQPALAGIKLAWWREALCRLDVDPAPPEPRLRAVATELLPLGVTGAEVAGIEEGWAALLQERVEASVVALRGERLFAVLAKLLGGEDAMLPEAGALFALSDAMRHGRGDFASERRALIGALAGRRTARRLRPVTLAARLAARDLGEPEGTPKRALALIAHRLTGVITGGR